uniref:Transposase n=1 Tax=Heterorhabditis bacteriophora TaxID=37862 RepID=A0A1I7XMY3_HETBA
MAFFCGKYSRYKNHHNIYGVDARTIYHLQNPRNWLPKFVERAMNRIKLIPSKAIVVTVSNW